jgi:HTH-type transcriptional regulator / antitoxin HigA
MVNALPQVFMPDYVSVPGDTLQDILDERGMTQAALALRTGRTKKHINEIIRGKAPITPETALQLERVLGTPAAFWNNREQQYRETLARIEEEKHLRQHTDWLNHFPLRDMIKRGWLTKYDDRVAQLREVLAFFGVAYPAQWDDTWHDTSIAFRKPQTRESNEYALAAWLREGERLAQDILCQPYKADTFRSALATIRLATRQPFKEAQQEVIRLCADAGVATVFVPELPGTCTHGATRWLSPNKALMQLSFRWKADDQIWFTLFHEGGHILLHGKREIFIEGTELSSAEEDEANAFAADFLISPKALQAFRVLPDSRTKVGIKRFAAELGIAPGIVVGRLQKEGHLPQSYCNDLKQRIAWDEDTVSE